MTLYFPPIPAANLQVSPTFDFRLRYERRYDKDFLSTQADSRSNLVSRIRPGFQLKYDQHFSGEIQYQLAQDELNFHGDSRPDRMGDMSLLNIKYVEKGFELTGGRQRINVGSERLIGAGEWTFAGRSFDGVKLKFEKVELFGFKVGLSFPRPNNQRIYGATYKSDLGQTSLILKNEKQLLADAAVAFNANIWTLSHWWTKKDGKWSFDFEGAYQTGKTQGRDLRAWALHGNAAHNFTNALKGFVEVNAASGGGNSDETNTFDNLLPTNHKFYGSMDMQSWRNMEEIAFGLDYQANPKLLFKMNWHKFALRSARDAWYGANGKPNVGPFGIYFDPTGNAGKDVGSEFDFEFLYKHTANITVSGGIGLFCPGNFIKNLNSGNSDSQFWSYLMVHFKM